MADNIPIQIVDENDNPIGEDTIANAQANGLKHRIVRIMVEDEDGKVLLQRRHPSKRTYPKCWDNSAAGHVDAGETYEAAAVRELQEEIGVSGYTLQEVKYYPTNRIWNGRILDRFNRLYKVTVPHKTPFVIQPEEVTEVRWFTRSEIRRLLHEHPNEVSDGLEEAYEICYK